MTEGNVHYGAELERIVGRSNVSAAPALGQGTRGPVVEVRPGSVEEVVELVRFAGARRLVLRPRGGGVHPLAGGVAAADIALSTRRLADVVEIDVANLTATVGAGMGLDALGALLAREGRRAGLDRFSGPEATVGGVVAADEGGPWRMGFGNPRDQVLGMKVVLGDGRIVSTGGRTVKNVAGYHLAPLFIGTYGRYGLITEVTLKLWASPRGAGGFRATFEDPREAIELAGALAHGRELPQPKALALIGAGDSLRGVELAASYEASPAALERVAARLPEPARGSWIAGDALGAFWRDVASIPGRSGRRVRTWKRSRAGLVETLEATGAAIEAGTALVVSFPGSGELWTAGGAAVEQFTRAADRLRSGFKARFDPRGVFGPLGRGAA